jgi:thiamine-phosphate pyrophosphorylase
LITDRRLVSDLGAAVEAALASLPPGAAAVQLREKDLAAGELLALARALAPVAARHEAPLLINDRLDVARLVDGAGVHLTSGSISVADARSLLPGRPIAASCHDPEELRTRAGADFATYSPIFPSPGKGPAIGLDVLRRVAATTTVPLYALGGVDTENAGATLSAGAWGIAAIRAWLVGDPAEATRRLWDAVQTA